MDLTDAIASLLTQECSLSFYLDTESYYVKTIGMDGDLERINIGLYCAEGGGHGEFSIRRFLLGGKATWKMEMFDDASHIIALFPELFRRLHETEDMKVVDMADWLRGMGANHIVHKNRNNTIGHPERILGIREIPEHWASLIEPAGPFSHCVSFVPTALKKSDREWFDENGSFLVLNNHAGCALTTSEEDAVKALLRLR